jgi:dipeptidyl aminopeptidase/acylaminoacyl peptidase
MKLRTTTLPLIMILTAGWFFLATGPSSFSAPLDRSTGPIAKSAFVQVTPASEPSLTPPATRNGFIRVTLTPGSVPVQHGSIQVTSAPTSSATASAAPHGFIQVTLAPESTSTPSAVNHGFIQITPASQPPSTATPPSPTVTLPSPTAMPPSPTATTQSPTPAPPEASPAPSPQPPASTPSGPASNLSPSAESSPARMAWSRDGKTLAASKSQGLYLYNAQPVRLERYIDAGVTVTTLAFAPDGSRLATGSLEGDIRLWQSSDGALLQTINGQWGGVNSVSFSPDGITLVAGYSDAAVRLWRIGDGGLLKTLEGHGGPVQSVIYSSDGSTLASASDDGTVRLWDARTGESLRTLKACCGGVNSVAFAPDGSALAAGYGDGAVRVWHVADGTLLHELTGAHRRVTSVAWSPDGATIAAASADQTDYLWKATDGTLLDNRRGEIGLVTSLAFAPDSQTLAMISTSGAVSISGLPGATNATVPTPAPTQPAASLGGGAPDRVTAEGLDTAVKLTWPSVTGAQGYFIYRDGSATPLNGDPTPETTYEDLGLSNGQIYRYSIGAVDQTGQVISHTVEITASPTSK